MKKITVLNAYGDKNIGDAAILKIALKFINEAYNNKCEISVFCESTKSYSNFIDNSKNIKPFQLPYGYAIRAEKKKVSSQRKIIRFINIYLLTVFYLLRYKFGIAKLPTKGFYSYLDEIKNADLIIGMGGGYLTTNKQITDYFGMYLTLLPVYIAKFFNKKQVLLPMSFGPFANSFHKEITYNAIKDTTIMARDQITLEQLMNIDNGNRLNKYYIPDLALFLKAREEKQNIKFKSNYIILTAREWFYDNVRQYLYEKSLVDLIDTLWKEYKLRSIFVPMARNVVEDDDSRVAKRIGKQVKIKNSMEVYTPQSINELQKLLSKARLAVCTRMHSAILASTTATPFIAIGYGHKTKGFVNSYKIQEWYIDINDVTYERLIKKLEKLIKKENYIDFINKLKNKNSTIYFYKNKIINSIKI